MINFETPIVAGTTLVRDAIQSQNFISGSQGWKVSSNGDAELNSVKVRGEFVGNTYESNANGTFYYAGTPANGNLIASIASADGTDAYGNSYLAGVCSYDSASQLYTQVDGGRIYVGNLVSGVLDPSEAAALSAGSYVGQLNLQSGLNSGNSDTNRSELSFVPGTATTTPGGTEPTLYVSDVTGTAVASLGVSGAVFHTSAIGGRLGIHTAAMQGNWVGGSSGTGAFGPLTWIYDAEDNTHINGTFHTTSTTPGTIVANGFPGSSIGANVSIVGEAVKFAGSAGQQYLPLYLNSSGEMRITGNPTYAVGDTYMINAVVPRGRLWT